MQKLDEMCMHDALIHVAIQTVVFDLLLVTTLQSTDNKITISYIKQIINPHQSDVTLIHI